MDPDESNHKLAYVGLELLGLARLLEWWAKPSFVFARRDEWEMRLDYFRSGVIAGVGSSITDKIAPEIVQGEFKLAYETLELLKHECSSWGKGKIVKRLQEQPIAYPGTVASEPSIVLSRPAPIPTSFHGSVERNLRSGKRPFDHLARRIVAKRLGITPRTVETHYDVEPRFTLLPAHWHLAGLFLDAVAFAPESLQQPHVAGLLDALFLIKYHVLAIYYLTRCTHRIPSRIDVSPCSPGVVARYCQRVAPGYQNGLFSRWCNELAADSGDNDTPALPEVP